MTVQRLSSRLYSSFSWRGDLSADPFGDDVVLLLKANSDGSLVDVSPLQNAFTAELLNTSTSVVKFAGTASVAFSGSAANYATLDDSASWDFGTGDFTVEGWFYVDNASSVKTYVSTYPEWELQHRSGAWVWGHGDPQIISRSYSTLNTWVHIAVCRSGTDMRMFFDGVQQGATVTNGDDLTSSNSLQIGRLSAALGQIPTGNMQELRITGAARYTANFTPPAQLT